MEKNVHCALCASAFVSTSQFTDIRANKASFHLLHRRPRYVEPCRRGASRLPLKGCAVNSTGDAGELDSNPEFKVDMGALRRRISDIKSGKSNEGKGAKSSEKSYEVVDMSRMDGASQAEVEEASKRHIEKFESVKSLWVIVFKSKSDGEEGVYSLSLGEDNIILAFEAQEEAMRYSLVLEMQDFPSAQICQLDSKELQAFCEKCGYRLGFVPCGALVTPPQESAIEDMDKWRGNSKGSSSGMSPDEVDIMKRRLENLFGQ